MRLFTLPDGGAVMHSVRESFAGILSLTLRGKRTAAALGPIYELDPAEEILAPFVRSAIETGWRADSDSLPTHVVERARKLRRAAVPAAVATSLIFEKSAEFMELEEWTRAGLVLEICRRRGVTVHARGLMHVPWRLRGTATGRFGTDPVRGTGWTFNPLSLSLEDRERIVPSGPGRMIAVLDFKAMDLCSMVSLVPGMAARYAGSGDLHATTVRILLGLDHTAEHEREIRGDVKEQFFVHAYGGDSPLRHEFEQVVPELRWLRDKPHGEGARLVQSQSSRAFRAALSRALPLLLDPDLAPMFTVHDELALDCSEGCSDRLMEVAKAMEEGASQRIGVPYRVGLSIGRTYEEAKSNA